MIRGPTFLKQAIIHTIEIDQAILPYRLEILHNSFLKEQSSDC